MTSKINKHTESINIVDGNIKNHIISDLAINPNYQNKVYASLYLNGDVFKKQFDSLDNFYNGITNNNNSLIDLLKKDSSKIKPKTKKNKDIKKKFTLKKNKHKVSKKKFKK
tara:strand:+ start:845 stop:1177 length:333 start_codon:yes stop_codon:yes gene_type:complete